MTKVELIDRISFETGFAKSDAASALDATLAVVKDALTDGQKVTLVGFGTFSVFERKARKGRNPRTGEEIEIPAAKVPKFTAGKTLKEAVR
ncbi:HU family DNA-binding protein [Thermodesulfovibrionales bacterium]|nr:HU family DNA-binding protein [Thermodesulfovibrionales bacterium]MCL0033256.1 HU family DNA-binding protein [Thermodesulfovibrionales bacterium]MCL0042504.1 HU family DNA-binding protein [Thermodesulfovibrionales bacterium]MCL0049832.1 HU family DNA-binding protein [Thermodesulfovibrionales bacterium]MCL0066497.1 HU family DNA-binding protein [Thermodesulfovibrionales bacterium]